MTILDANLLLYAYNADAPQQKASAQWLQELLKSGGIIGLPWVSCGHLFASAPIPESGRIRNPPRKHLQSLANG